MRADGKTAFDLPPERVEQSDRDFLSAIKEHGWSATSVFADEEGPGYGFTAGFDYSLQAPELVMFSLPGDAQNELNWEFWRRLQSGWMPQIGLALEDFLEGGLQVVLLPMAKRYYPDYLGRNRWFYGGDDFEALVLYWPDRAGYFPWQAGFDEDLAALQPDVTAKGWSDLA